MMARIRDTILCLEPDQSLTFTGAAAKQRCATPQWEMQAGSFDPLNLRRMRCLLIPGQ